MITAKIILVLILFLIISFFFKQVRKDRAAEKEYQNTRTARLALPVTKEGHYPFLLINDKDEFGSPPPMEYLPPIQSSAIGPKIGLTEEYFFEEYLCFYFDRRKLTNGQVKTLHWYPDFTYIDRKQQIYIAIEVDEPYSCMTMEGIHCKENPGEQKRHEAMMQKGWNIIRFSEEQIHTQPNECCKFIASCIAFLSSDPVVLKDLRTKNLFGNHNLKHAKRWTKQEGDKMASYHLRAAYLMAPYGIKSIKQLLNIRPKDFNPYNLTRDSNGTILLNQRDLAKKHEYAQKLFLAMRRSVNVSSAE